MGETGVQIQSLPSAHLALRLHYSSPALHYLSHFASHFVTCFIHTEALRVCGENNIDQGGRNPGGACAEWLGVWVGWPAILGPKPDVHGLSCGWSHLPALA